jgi:hypothetical protein
MYFLGPEEAPPPRRKILVKVSPLVVPDASPPLRAWQVIVETEKGEWHESFASEAELLAFERGVRAGAAALGCFDVERDQ